MSYCKCGENSLTNAHQKLPVITCGRIMNVNWVQEHMCVYTVCVCLGVCQRKSHLPQMILTVFFQLAQNS